VKGLDGVIEMIGGLLLPNPMAPDATRARDGMLALMGGLGLARRTFGPDGADSGQGRADRRDCRRGTVVTDASHIDQVLLGESVVAGVAVRFGQFG